MAPHSTPCRQRYPHGFRGLCGWLHRSFQSATTRQKGTATTAVTRPLGLLCRLGPNRGTTRVYMTHGPGSASSLISKGSKEGPLNLHSWVARRHTQVGSCAETVGQHHGERKDPCWWDRSCIKLMWPNTKKFMNLEEEGLLWWAQTDRTKELWWA
jgi:hypothetical protein